MTDETRHDAVPIARATITPEGFLRDTPVIGRAGVQTYRRADGSMVREYRPPEVVFAEPALAAIHGIPIIDLHVPAVTAANARMHTVGTVLSPGVLLMLGAAMAVLTWYAVLDPVTPIVSVGETRMEVRGGVLRITRVMCAKRDDWGLIEAELLSVPETTAGAPPAVPLLPAGPAGAAVLEGPVRYSFVAVPLHVEQGCWRRHREWTIPAGLPPGRFRYASAVQFCNRFGSCVTTELPSPGEIEIRAAGDDAAPSP